MGRGCDWNALQEGGRGDLARRCGRAEDPSPRRVCPIDYTSAMSVCLQATIV